MTSYIFNCWHGILIHVSKHVRNGNCYLLFRREIYKPSLSHLTPCTPTKLKLIFTNLSCWWFQRTWLEESPVTQSANSHVYLPLLAWFHRNYPSRRRSVTFQICWPWWDINPEAPTLNLYLLRAVRCYYSVHSYLRALYLEIVFILPVRQATRWTWHSAQSQEIASYYDLHEPCKP